MNSFRDDYMTVRGNITDGLLSCAALHAQSAERAAE